MPNFMVCLKYWPAVPSEKMLKLPFTRKTCYTDLMSRNSIISQGMADLLDSVYNPMLVIDQDGVVVVCNRAAEKMLRVPRKNFLGKPLTAVLETSRLHTILKTGKTESVQKIVISGKTYISNRSPVTIDGEILGAVAVLQDISELELISTELEYTRKLTSELTAIIESSFDGIYVTDGNAKTIRVNKSYERITGIKREELLGRTMYELVDEGYFNESVTLRVLASGQPESIVQEIKTGKTVMVTGTPITDENDDIHTVVTNVRDVTELHRLQRELKTMESLQTHYREKLQRLKDVSGSGYIIQSKKMWDVYDLAMRLAQVDSTVLIQGESGVGKEVVANLIHSGSTRKDKPFLKISCAAIPENLLESELFGYAPGAFTGAHKNGKPGLFEMSHQGTLLLDEMGEMPLGLQAKLLRVVQEKQCVRIGSSQPVSVDVRILAATNRDIEAMVHKKEFRKDLFFRLNVVPVHVPPLRERKEAIVSFILHFLDRYNKKYDFKKQIDSRAMDIFYNYSWPGNVRELENLVERVVVVTPGHIISSDNLPSGMKETARTVPDTVFQNTSLKAALANLEKTILTQVLSEHKSTRKAARILCVDQSTVVRKAKRYQIPLS
jgi:PAS domain S-box-containing protein